MKIVCDTNLPLGRTLFSTLGQVTLADGSRLTPEMVRDADMLMVRDVPLPRSWNTPTRATIGWTARRWPSSAWAGSAG